MSTEFDCRISIEESIRDERDERFKAEYVIDGMRPLKSHNILQVPNWCVPYLEHDEAVLFDHMEEASMGNL